MVALFIFASGCEVYSSLFSLSVVVFVSAVTNFQ